MEQLVIRLGSDADAPIHWLVWSTPEEEIIASGQLQNAHALATLTERAGYRPVIALVSSADCYLTQLALPAKASRKAAQAIPFMLEDDLTGDLEQQFFALGERLDGQQTVAVVTKEQMRGWLNMLNEAGLQCSKILPDTLTLPHFEDGWTMLALEQELLIRQDSWMGMQGQPVWLYEAIELHAKHQTEPLKIHCYGVDELPKLANVTFEKHDNELAMATLAKGALASKFNLLQGQFKVKRKTSNSWQKWRIAASLAALVLIFNLVDKVITVQQLKSEKEQLSAEIRTEFKRAFPETSRIVNVRSQMKRKIAELEQGGGSVSLLAFMSQLSDAFAQTNVKPQTLRFDAQRNELRLQAEAANFEALEKFKTLTEAKGFEVQSGAINNKDDQVIGSLAIRS